MKILTSFEQGSPEWKQARAGKVTASRAKDARDKLKSGAASGKQIAYACQVALERLSGQPADATFENWQMREGHVQEPIARAAYERRTGNLVDEVGAFATDDDLGLSPLARGNRRRKHCHHARLGPIPARAGQPGAFRLLIPSIRAYPRSRGATHLEQRPRQGLKGLSPLARGNRLQALQCRIGVRPIPARAGQPTAAAPAVAASRAYPRSRGATSAALGVYRLGEGLSPLARGNRCSAMRAFTSMGPIPARAGQPAEALSY